MKDLLLHPVTEQQLAAFSAQPGHALVLIGPAGSGKRAMADNLAEGVLGLAAGSLPDYPYHLSISADGKTIGIETVRELERFLTLKVPRQASYTRTVIIDGAQALSTEAQNALLKTLEEPPEGVLLILTATQPQALLPTIRSRIQTISVQRPERGRLEEYFKDRNFAEPAIKQAYAISGGLPGLMAALLEQTDHPLLAATERARQLLSQTAYERLLMVDELAKQRDLALDTMLILQQMAHVSLQTASGAAATKWQAVLRASYQAAESLAQNAQPKLALTNLMLNL